jgi:hypothetical protein
MSNENPDLHLENEDESEGQHIEVIDLDELIEQNGAGFKFFD